MCLFDLADDECVILWYVNSVSKHFLTTYNEQAGSTGKSVYAEDIALDSYFSQEI